MRCQCGARLEPEEGPLLRRLRGGPSASSRARPPDAQSRRRDGERRRGAGTPYRHT
jgi:hypothetical protein